MTNRQKLILIVLGVLDLIVIAGLVIIVVRQTRQIARPAVTLPLDDPCAEALLSAMVTTDRAVTVAWSPDVAHLTVDLTAERRDTPGEQHLWIILDAIPAPLPASCPVPETILLSVQVPSGGRHTVQIDGEDLANWLAGVHSDEDLVNRARYRTSPHPSSP
jgi:hypothetical protein